MVMVGIARPCKGLLFSSKNTRCFFGTSLVGSYGDDVNPARSTCTMTHSKIVILLPRSCMLSWLRLKSFRHSAKTLVYGPSWVWTHPSSLDTAAAGIFAGRAEVLSNKSVAALGVDVRARFDVDDPGLDALDAPDALSGAGLASKSCFGMRCTVVDAGVDARQVGSWFFL